MSAQQKARLPVGLLRSGGNAQVPPHQQRASELGTLIDGQLGLDSAKSSSAALRRSSNDLPN